MKLKEVWMVSKSKIAGEGVFAKEDIPKGYIMGHTHTLIGEVNKDYVAGDITILGTKHNHSYKPNAVPTINDRKIYLEALRNISKGSEITCDYNNYSSVLNIERPQEEWQ